MEMMAIWTMARERIVESGRRLRNGRSVSIIETIRSTSLRCSNARRNWSAMCCFISSCSEVKRAEHTYARQWQEEEYVLTIESALNDLLDS